jgi:hypothetical protein
VAFHSCCKVATSLRLTAVWHCSPRAKLSVRAQRSSIANDIRDGCSKHFCRPHRAQAPAQPNMASGYGLNGGELSRVFQWLPAGEQPLSSEDIITLTWALPSLVRRPVPVLPLLAGAALVLRGQQHRRRRLGKKEVCARDGGLLRVPSPPERGALSPQLVPPTSSDSKPLKTPG